MNSVLSMLQDSMPPLDMFVHKILLSNLATRSAYRRLGLCLVIGAWRDQYGDAATAGAATEELGATLQRYLTEAVNYDETIAAFTQLQVSNPVILKPKPKPKL